MTLGSAAAAARRAPMGIQGLGLAQPLQYAMPVALLAASSTEVRRTDTCDPAGRIGGGGMVRKMRFFQSDFSKENFGVFAISAMFCTQSAYFKSFLEIQSRF